MTQKKYHIIDKNNEQTGPYSIDELKEMSLHPYTPVWEYGPGNWQHIKDIEGLKVKKPYGRKDLLTTIFLIGLLIAIIAISIWLIEKLPH